MPEIKIYLDFTDITIGHLMQALTEQLRGWHESAGFDVQNDTIVIAPDTALKRSYRINDVADLAKDATDADVCEYEISTAIRFCQEERYWACGVLVHGQGEWLNIDAGQAMILQTQVGHRQIQAFLAAMRQARADGSGPCISRSRVMGRDSLDTLVRFYDVRDLDAGAEYTHMADNSDQAWQTHGISALAGLISDHRHFRQDAVSQVCGATGRLIIEGKPEFHDWVKQTLGDVRAGKKFQGLRLIPARPKSK